MKSLSAKYKGIVTGMVIVAIALILFYGVHLPTTGLGQLIIWALYACGIVWSLIAYKEVATENKSFKNYFSEGFKTFIIATLMMVVYTFIFYKMNPQIFENVIKENNLLLIKEGNHTGPEIAHNEKNFRGIFIPGLLMGTTLTYLFIGALVSVIGAGFLSQKKES